MPSRGYVNPNLALAAQAGESIAQLFAGRYGNNAARSKYALEASQRYENDAQARNALAEAALREQEVTRLGELANPSTVAQLFSLDGADPAAAARAQMLASAFGISNGAQDAVQAMNTGQGGIIMSNQAATEGDMRRGYALTGHDASINNPMTKAGIADLFGQQTSLNNADNAAEVQKQRIASAASMYGDNLQYGPGGSVDRTTETHYGVGGATDRAATIAGTMRLVAGGIGPNGEPAKPMTPAEVASMSKQIENAVASYTTNPKDIALATQFAVAEAQRTGNVAAAIQTAATRFKDSGERDDDGFPIARFDMPLEWGGPQGNDSIVVPSKNGVANIASMVADLMAKDPNMQPEQAQQIASAVASGKEFTIPVKPAKPAKPVPGSGAHRRGRAMYGGREIPVVDVSTPEEARAAWAVLPRGQGLRRPDGQIKYKE